MKELHDRVALKAFMLSTPSVWGLSSFHAVQSLSFNYFRKVSHFVKETVFP